MFASCYLYDMICPTRYYPFHDIVSIPTYMCVDSADLLPFVLCDP